VGYTTDFSGTFKLNKKLSEEDHTFLNKFNETRRMGRNVDPKYGVEGEFYVDGGGAFGQDSEDNVINNNQPPKTQPGLWCQWRPTDDGMGIEWDGGEKFYEYVAWIEYLIDKVLGPRGYVLNGEVEWEGEESGDLGKISIKDNVVTVFDGIVSYGPTKEPEVGNYEVYLAIHHALTMMGLKSDGGNDSDTGGIENHYSKGDYKVTIEMRN
jgi:hypothetical protein